MDASWVGSSLMRSLPEENLLITLRAYLDSSGKLQNKWITLAAAAAPESIWKDFETDWKQILDTHTPKASYIHMKEVFRLEKGFDSNLGWTHESAFGVVNQCVSYVSTRAKDRFRVFYCSVDLEAWQKLRSETYQMPDPIDLCNQFCSEAILMWYGFLYPQVIDPNADSVYYFFDRNEYFFRPFHDKWERERVLSGATGRWSLWNAIEEVAPVDMKKTPGIQMADIIAWTRNRETFTKDGDIAHYLPNILKQVIPTTYVVWDEAKLRQQYKPLIYLP